MNAMLTQRVNHVATMHDRQCVTGAQRGIEPQTADGPAALLFAGRPERIRGAVATVTIAVTGRAKLTNRQEHLDVLRTGRGRKGGRTGMGWNGMRPRLQW